jgi:tetratricopeptide (TPR) repeat protein
MSYATSPAFSLRAATCWGAALIALLWALPGASAEERLIDQEPYDLLTVPDGTETKVLEVQPVRLPNRRLPTDPKPNDKIRVRLVDDEEVRDFEVLWRDVKKLELFEQRVLAQAQSFVAAQQFDDAYDSFAYLLKNDPTLPGLKEAIESFWYVSAGAAFREKRYDEALAVLEELLGQNPHYKHSETSPPLMRVLGDIVEKLVQRYLERNDYRSAHQMLSRIAATYPTAKEQPFYPRLTQEMIRAAEQKRDEARQHLAAERFTQAYDAATAMLEMWPEVSGARELSEEIAQRYPLVVVAVEQVAPQSAGRQLNHWASQRVGRLVDPRLMELLGLGPEGGDYACAVGSCARSDDNRSLAITLSAGQPPSRTVAVAALLSAGAQADQPFFSPGWAEVLGGIRLAKADQVEVALRRSFVLPEALLAFPLHGAAASEWFAAGYTYVAGDATHARYVLSTQATSVSGQPREILERQYPSAEAVLLALQRGEIDAIDRVQPADLQRVRSVPGVQVGRYAVPTVHVLVPNPDRPWSKNRTFRRAFLYGLNRELILSQGILQGAELSAARLVSGPFPAPVATNDPLAYAYDSSVAAHAYEPLLAATLLQVAKREAAALAQQNAEKAPQLDGITLGHLPLELHRTACKAIVKQLAPLGIPCKLLQVDGVPGDLEACDFLYTELQVSEPVVDVERLFGPQGSYPATNPHVRLGVRQVQQSATWNEAGQRLRQLHRTLHEDLTVLPLWQVPEHYAVRSNVRGVAASPVSFYQAIDAWRVSSRLGTQ